MVNIYPLYQKERTSVYPNRRLFSIWFISLVCIALGVVTTPYLSVISLLLFFVALLVFQAEEMVLTMCSAFWPVFFFMMK